MKLREHFRCVPEIIQFSNALSYNFEILPLRDPASAAVGPAVVPHRVDRARSEDNVNDEEARHVASLVAAALEHPAYAGLTFGVISLLGSHQHVRIESMLRAALTVDEYEERRLLCGAPPNFQGDERDVVFLSLVDGRPEGPGPHRRRGDPGDLFKKRFNVAVSRARDQLWVVHSLDRQTDLQPDDLRRRLLDFAFDPAALTRGRDQARAQADSDFEKAVIDRLTSAGHRVQGQYPAGAYRIDIVVSADDNRLAIECDGDAYHWTDDELRRDLDRQTLLERLGWRFHRIRGSEFYRDPDAAMGRVFERLKQLGIRPNVIGNDEHAHQSTPSAVVAEVEARAAVIREEWRRRGIITRPSPPPDGGSTYPPPSGDANGEDGADDDSPDPKPSPPAGDDADAQAPTGGQLNPAPAVRSPSGAGPLIFESYEEASLLSFRTAQSLHEESDQMLHPMMMEVARVEGPVHFETLIERLRGRYGLQRAGERIRSHVLRSLDRLAARETVIILRQDAGGDLFVSIPDNGVKPRGPGIYGTRRIMHVAPAELEEGVLRVLQDRRRMYRDELIQATRDALGYRRTGDDIHAALDFAIDTLIRRGVIREDYGRLAPAE